MFNTINTSFLGHYKRSKSHDTFWHFVVAILYFLLFVFLLSFVMDDDNDKMNDDSKPIVIDDSRKYADSSSDDDNKDDIPPNVTNFMKIKEEKVDDPRDNDDQPNLKVDKSVELVDTDEEESVMEVDPTTTLDIDKSKENPFIHNFPFPFPTEATSIDNMCCKPDDVHIAVLQCHLVKRIHGRNQPWRIKAYETFCKHRKLHMQELHEWEQTMVEDAINKAGAPPISGTLRLRDQLTIPHVSRFLCLFYGAYRSMLRKKMKTRKTKSISIFVMQKGHFMTKFIKCVIRSVSHTTKKLITITPQGWRCSRQFMKRNYEQNLYTSQNWYESFYILILLFIII